jgi:integrase
MMPFTMGDMRRDKGAGEQPRWLPSLRRWRARYVDAQGRRQAVYSAIPGRAGERECARRRDAKLREARVGLLGDPAQTLGDYLERWLVEVAAQRLRPRSFERYAGIVRRYIAPRLGSIRLRELRGAHIAGLYAELARPRRITITHARSRTSVRRAASPASIRYVHAVLHGALEQALAWHLLERNPADRAPLPRAVAPEMRALAPDEARRFLEALHDHPLEALFTVAITTGMRQGELLALRWRDLAGSRLHVRQTLARLRGEWWLGEPKTRHSRRAIAITPATRQLLRAHRARMAEALLANGIGLSDETLIFCDASGQPLHGRHVTTRHLGPLLRAAGLPAIRFHDLRHTFATLQLAAGTNPKVVSEALGHKDIAITLDRYSHALPTMQAEAMRRLDALLGRGSEAVPHRPHPDKGSYKGSYKGSSGRLGGTNKPDLSSDRAENDEVGTAYRIRTGDLRLERAVS